MMKNLMKLFLLLVSSMAVLHADLKWDLNTINNSIVDLNRSIGDVNVTADAMCAPLIALDQQARSIVESLAASNGSMSAPITVDNELLVLVDTLVVNVASLSGSSVGLSSTIVTLQPTADVLTLKDGITAMLQLSSDIGEMADRIGEMADTILIMADNIGLMADRILLTQELQSTNVALTQNNILISQTNMLSLVAVTQTATYDLSLDQLVIDGELLVARMMAVVFSPWNLSSQLSSVQTDVSSYLQQVQLLKALFNDDTVVTRMYVNDGSMASLSTLSTVMTSLGSVMDAYVIAIDAIKSITSDRTLSSSMKSILTLSSDIGKMSNTIGEMADQILAMADNIGMSADQILLTQQSQALNMAATQASILGAQQMAIGILAAIN